MHATRLARAAAGPLTLAVLLAGGLAACSGSSDPSGSSESPAATSPTPVSAQAALLDAAAKTLSTTPGVRLRITGQDVPETGTRLISGQGTMVRSTEKTATGVAAAGSFKGSVSLVLDGTPSTVPVISTGGKVYARIPGAPAYREVNLTGFGIGDPAALLDPTAGIPQVFSGLTGVTGKGTGTIGGTAVQQVEGTVPGESVGTLLGSAGVSGPVRVRLSIDPATRELRRAVLSGSLFDGQDGSYTLNLDRYGKTIGITAPTT